MSLLLRLIAKLVGALSPPVDPGRVKKVLIADLSFIGDIVMTSVVHRAVREQYPHAAIHILGFPVVENILPLLPMIDRFHPVRKGKRLSQVVAAIGLRRERFDLAIHVNTGLWTNFLVYLTGAKIRLGYDYGGRGCFHQIRIPIATRTVKTIYRRHECVDLVDRAFGWTSSTDIPVLTLPAQVETSVDALLSSWGVADGDFLVGIHTSSRQDREIRCWDEEKFAAVANRLIEFHGAKVVFTDVASDRPFVEPIIAGIARKDRIVGEEDRIAGGKGRYANVTLPELYGLLKRIDLFITINTAPMHLAVDAGTPLVAIVGYAPGRIYFPPDDDRFQWIEDPALQSYDPELIVQTAPSRMGEINVADVMKKVEYLVDNVIKNRKAQ